MAKTPSTRIQTESRKDTHTHKRRLLQNTREREPEKSRKKERGKEREKESKRRVQRAGEKRWKRY